MTRNNFTDCGAQIAVRYRRGLEQLVDALGIIQFALHRFDRYEQAILKRVQCPELEDGLFKVNIEFIGFCQDAIAFYSGRWICACSTLHSQRPGLQMQIELAANQTSETVRELLGFNR